MGDQDRAFMPARWECSVRRSLKGVEGVGDGGTAQIFMLASALAVARRVESGENLADVIPRAWALGRLKRGVKVRRGLEG